MRLSPAGERYADACRRILADLEEAEKFVADEGADPHGILTISAPPIAGEEVLRPILDEFLAAFPAVSARLQLLDRHVNLIEEGVDLALRVADLPDSSLVAVKVGGDVRRVVAAAPGYLAQHPTITRPGDLASHQIVAMSNFGTDRWVFPPEAGSVAPRTVTFTPRILVNSVRAARASAIDGMGVTRLYAYHLADEVRAGRLRIVLADAEHAPVPAHLVAQPVRTPGPQGARLHRLRGPASARGVRPPGGRGAPDGRPGLGLGVLRRGQGLAVVRDGQAAPAPVLELHLLDGDEGRVERLAQHVEQQLADALDQRAFSSEVTAVRPGAEPSRVTMMLTMGMGDLPA
jgi:DNA-binding transcriptional LysR family regulator